MLSLHVQCKTRRFSIVLEFIHSYIHVNSERWTYTHIYIHTYTQDHTRQQHTELDPKDQSESARVVTLSQLAHQVAPGGTGDATGSLLVLRAWLKRIALAVDIIEKYM